MGLEVIDFKLEMKRWRDQQRQMAKDVARARDVALLWHNEGIAVGKVRA